MIRLYVVTVVEDGKPRQQAACYTIARALRLYQAACSTVGPENVHLNPTRLELGPTLFVVRETWARLCAAADVAWGLASAFIWKPIEEKLDASQDSKNLQESAQTDDEDPGSSC